MGSEDFPKQNELSSFFSLNGGFDNAHTGDDETNFYFSIGCNALKEGVRKFTSFFKSPLLLNECINKERQAVHEEYILWTNDDNCRKWEVLKQLASKNSKRFSIGNNETLSHDKIRDQLKEFHSKYYSSNIMTACLKSNCSIE